MTTSLALLQALLRELIVLPRPLAGFKGPTFKRTERREGKRRGDRMKGRRRKGKRREGG